MSAKYEFWLTDDAGRRMYLMKDLSFVSYTRTVHGYPTIQLGLPLKVHAANTGYIFVPDWRVDVWRSPDDGYPLRREGSFLLRKWNIYDRVDGMRMLMFYGRGPIDILRRWSVVTTTESEYTQTDYADDLMKNVVRWAFITTARVVPTGEFTVEGDTSLGPSITQSFQGKTVLDVVTNLKATTLQMNFASSSNRKIYFDVVEDAGLSDGFGYKFKTYADQRGVNRSTGIIFSPENGNLKEAAYSEDHLDSVTEATVGSTTIASNDRYLSRWNRILAYNTASQDATADQATAYQLLSDGRRKAVFSAQFLSTPGSPSTPRSLYGVDWDMGDILPVNYIGNMFNIEVQVVYVSVNEEGKENVVGMNQVGTA